MLRGLKPLFPVRKFLEFFKGFPHCHKHHGGVQAQNWSVPPSVEGFQCIETAVLSPGRTIFTLTLTRRAQWAEDHSGESPLHSKALKKTLCSINKYLCPESWKRAGMYSGKAAQEGPLSVVRWEKVRLTSLSGF